MASIYNVTIDPKEKDNHFRIIWQKKGTGNRKSFIEPGKVFYEIEKLRGQWFQRKNRMDVGRKLFRLLDGKDRFFLNALEEAKRQGEILHINLYTYDAVSSWPFELLAYGNRFYVPYDLHLVRCASHRSNNGSITPQSRPLELLFMTSPGHSPGPVPPGESEEKVISQVKRFQGIVTTIEYSGTLKGLYSQLKIKRFDVLYLTGNFDIDESGLPYLIMNGPGGKEENRRRVYPGDLWDDALRENPPLLLFMTSFYEGVTKSAMENFTASYFGQQLTKHYHLPAVLVWNPPARDPWINATEISFLRELGQGKTIIEAVHRVRIELYQRTRNRDSILWAMLQLYGTGITLNAIVDKSRNKQRVSLKDDSIENNRHSAAQQEDSSKYFYIHRQPLQTENTGPHLENSNHLTSETHPAIPASNMNMMNMNHDVHGMSSSKGQGALRKIRQFSQIAFRDAGFVSESPHSKDGPDIRLERNLYVERIIEKDIHKFLDDRTLDESSLLLIFGEAGSGKTSLLWHFFHSLSRPENASREPWFIKSSILYTSIDHEGTSSASDFQLTLSELSAAAAEVKRKDKQAVILLDTVDLLLHSEKHREYLMVVLRTLEEYGCQIIAASRPQEANHLFAQADYKKLLGEYEGKELEKAIITHVCCFYGRAYARDMKEHIETILNAVSNGLQIREVCFNPLTLRMLFTLYAPQDIPKEINTFELYCNYWEMRVVKDHRAGSSYSTREDLGEIATMLALAMLAEGAPELRKMVQEQRFQQLTEISSQLEKLEARRIIQQSEDKTLRFFHQTFFEHCAARALLMKYRRQVIPLLKNRTEANPNDLFVSPILEQVLLLIENETQPLRKQGDRFLLHLLQSNHQLLKCSGLYVYVHRKETDYSLNSVVRHILADSEYAAVNHFLRLAPNMPQVEHRYRILFQELDIAWSRDSADARDIILELLERFSSRFPGYVEDFLKNHNILDFSPDLWNLGFKTIINIMEILVINSPPRRRQALIDKMIRVLEQKISGLLIIRIMDALQRLSVNLNTSATANRCEQAMKALEDRDDQKHSIPLGRLFYIQWKNTKTPVEKILEELSSSQGFAFKARLRGLYRILLTAGRQEASLAWEYFIAETDDNKKWMWAHLVIPSMINGYPVAHDQNNENREIKTGSPGTSPSILFFREKAKALFTRWSTRYSGNEWDSKDIAAEADIFQKICKAVVLANPGKEILLDLLSAPALKHSSPWLSIKFFGDLLAYAYNAGNSGAVEAMQLLVSQPGEYPKKLIQSICLNFIELDICHPSVLKTAVSFYVKTAKAKLLRKFLETNSNQFQTILLEWQDKIDALARQLSVDSSEKNRKVGFGLWKCLVNCLGVEAPPFTELVTLLENETKNHLKSPIIQLIGLKTDIPAGDVMRVLLPYMCHLDENVSTRAVKSTVDILLKSGTDMAPYAGTLLEAILEPPVLVESVRRFGPVLPELVPSQSQLALELLERLIVTCNTRIKNRSKRNLLNYFRVPVRRVLHYAPKSSFDRFLQLVPELKPEMGLLIVEAVCREAFNEMVPKLDVLLGHPDVPGKVKELIRRHKYNRERTLGGEGWPELEELLSSDFYNAAGKDRAQSIPGQENKNEPKKKILFLSANQAGEARLSMDREFRAIDNALRGSKYRRLLELIPKFAVSYNDIRKALLDHEPIIVHFSGHGSKEGLIVLEEDGIFPEPMPTEVVSGLFELFSNKVFCVILSACYSEEQATAIVRYIPYVIGMGREIQDNAAIEFSKGFYDALGAGRSIEDAFQFGCQAILKDFPELPQYLIPVLKKNLIDSSKTIAVVTPLPTEPVPSGKEGEKGKLGARIDLSRLPAHTVPEFVGRSGDIAELERFFETQTPHIVSLVGFGGVGKSALIAAFLDKIAPGFGQVDHAFGWSFYSQGSHETSASSHLFFEEAIKFFDPQGTVPGGDSERVTRLLQLLRTGRSLLILDGLEPLQRPSNVDGGRIRDRGILWLLTDIAQRGIDGLVLVSSRQPLVELRRFSSSYREIKVEDLDHDAGASLLRSIGVKGEENQLVDASRAFGGNALALVLLANLLVSRYKGAVGYWKTLPIQALDAEHGSHARRILTYYSSIWPRESPEKVMLWVMSLVDRPLDYHEFAALRDNAAFASTLPPAGSPEFNQLLSSLRTAGILNRQEPVLECHPMIRTYFSLTFERESGRDYKEAHSVLFDYFSKLPSSRFPVSIGEMEPLYRSIRHGCLAGKPQEALQVYYKRIQHNDSSFSLYQLGAFDTDLSALANFFPDGWSGEPIPGITQRQANDILTTASYCLLSLARMEEAIDVLYLKLNWVISNKDLFLAFSVFENLVEALTQCGRLQEAEEVANKALNTMSPGFSPEQFVEVQADAAYVGLYRGKIDEVCEKYRRIETSQPANRQPLSGYEGCQFCEALLAKGDMESLREVIQRADKGIRIARTENMFLHLALFELAKGRALLLLGQRDKGRKALLLAGNHAREAGSEETLAFVLAAAGTALPGEEAVEDDCSRAKLWLDEAALIAENRKMILTKIDVKLGFAKLALLSGDHDTAVSETSEAETMIEQTGYYLARHLHRSLWDKLANLKSN